MEIDNRAQMRYFLYEDIRTVAAKVNRIPIPWEGSA